MAIPKVTASNEDAICPIKQSLEDIDRVKGATTHKADGSYIWRVVKAGGTGKVSAPVSAPITEKG
jgi:hypothetical protein